MIWNNKFGGVFSVIISILHYLHLIKTVCCRMYLVAFRKCSWLWCFVLFIPKCINITAKLSTFFCFPSICVHEFINSYFSLFFPLVWTIHSGDTCLRKSLVVFFSFVMVDEKGENHVIEKEFFFCSLWKQNASLYTSSDTVGLTNKQF